MMTPAEPRRSAIHRPPPEITARSLRALVSTARAVTVLDVRQESVFRAGHIPNSVNAPESGSTALVKKVQQAERAVLVCDDGRLSVMVARMLGVCGFPDVAVLKGGLQAWVAEGGPLMETTRSGNERLAIPWEDPVSVPVGWVEKLYRRITPRLVFIGLAASALVLIVARFASA